MKKVEDLLGVNHGEVYSCNVYNNADALKAKTRDKDEQVLAESVSRQLPLIMTDEKAEELNDRMKCRKIL